MPPDFQARPDRPRRAGRGFLFDAATQSWLPLAPPQYAVPSGQVGTGVPDFDVEAQQTLHRAGLLGGAGGAPVRGVVTDVRQDGRDVVASTLAD